MPAENALNTGTNPADFSFVSSQDDNGVGTIRWNANGTKCYKWVKMLNTSTVACVAGTLVGYQKAANSGYPNSLVSADTSADSDAVPIPAGCCTATIAGTAATAYFLWVQIKGLVTLALDVTNGLAGDEFLLSTTDSQPTIRLDASLAKAAGISIDAASSTKRAILDCPF